MSFRAHSEVARRALVAVLLGAAPSALGACVSFDDATATQGYFDLAQATRVCARVFSCPGLATSLRRSIGAPVDGENFSTCMSWLAGPSPAPPGGFAAQAAVLAQVGAATSCDSAASGLDVVPLGPDYPACADVVNGGCTPSGDVFDCTAGQLIRCPGSQHAAGSTCDASTLRCVSGCTAAVDAIGACTGAGEIVCADPAPREEIVCAAYGETCVTDMVTSPLLLKHPIDLSLCTNDNGDPPVCGDAQAEGDATCTADGAMVVCNHLRTVASAIGSVTFGAVEVVYPCQSGWPCTAPGASSFPYCERPEAACSPGDPGVNTCDGSTLVACVAGQSQRLDCAAAGASCKPAAGGTTGAFCAFGP